MDIESIVFHVSTQLGFPVDAVRYFRSASLALISAGFADKLQQAAISYMSAESEDYEMLISDISDGISIDIRSVSMLMLLICAPALEDLYRQNSISEVMYSETLSDLCYKLSECKTVHNIWGTRSLKWQRSFFLLKRFAFGRLQIEEGYFTFDSYKDCVFKGDKTYYIHIHSGDPLLYEDVIDSLKRAYRFYGYNGEVIPFVCNSWLLYPPQSELYTPESNLRRFYDMFEVINSEADHKNSNFWRVFGIDYENANFASLPSDTTLRRRFISYFNQGNTLGTGYGILFFDGKKVI